MRPAAPALLLLAVSLGPALPHGAGAEPPDGERITAASRERLRPLLPEEIYARVVEGFEGLDLRLVPRGDYRPASAYVEATARHACQSRLDEHGQIEGHVAGQPFPYSEWAQEATDHACDLDPDDPRFALKLAWNANYRWVGGGTLDYPLWGQSFGRGYGETVWKIARGSYRRTWFSHRADLLPDSDRIDPDTDVEWAEFTETVYPFDARGTKSLIFRYEHSHDKHDDAWVYVPSFRRVRRLSTGQKTDRIQGSNIAYEDFFLFSSYVWAQEWRFAGEREMVVPMDTERDCYPRSIPGWGDDGDTRFGEREDFESCRFGPYGALPFVDERWQRRTVVRLEQTPRRGDAPYARKSLWYDKQTFAPLLFVTRDAEGEPIRMGWYISDWSETSPIEANRGRRAIIPVAYLLVNFRDGTTNRNLFFASTIRELPKAEILEYFDVTRLKEGR